MSEAAADSSPAPRAPQPEQDPPHRAREGLRRGRVLVMAAALGATALAGTWLIRERIADTLITRQLRDLGLPATYRIESIGPRQQVLRDIVIGDPRHPDLTIERAEIALSPRFGLPAIGRVRLVRPRLYGVWRGAPGETGSLSFGRLDPLLRGQPGAAPFRLPALDLSIVDGRARLDGAHGVIGLSFEGQGGLRDGFAGSLAATAPHMGLPGCALRDARLYGQVRIDRAQPRFAGPLRTAAMRCDAVGGVDARDAQLDISARLAKSLDAGTARLALRTGGTTLGTIRARGWTGTTDLTLGAAGLTARYDIAAQEVEHPQLAGTALDLSGLLRARGGWERWESEGTLGLTGARPGPGLGRMLATARQAGAGTLAEPLLRQLGAALDRETRNSHLTADYIARGTGSGVNLVVPRARVTGASGALLVAVSRLQVAMGQGPLRLAGNFTTGGSGLPRITGRLDEGLRGRTRLVMTMADYRAGDARIAVPRLTLVQDRSGALAFTGLLQASGALPGGHATNLSVPLDGARDARGELALWRGCTDVAFSALTLGSLSFDQRAVRLCPAAGGAMVKADRRGVRIALGTPGLDLSGRLGETPIRLTTGAVGYGQPGAFFARAIDVTLGPAPTASRFRVSDLRAEIGREVRGTFSGADIRLASVPLDMLGAQGTWRLADGRLSIADAVFRLEDRAQVDRFQPLSANRGTLSLSDNVITANILLNEPTTKREIVSVSLKHDLARARGHADLTVAGLDFDPALQPAMLTRDLLGVVANVRGRVEGTGRIDWTGERVTSTGRFRTAGLDLAAAFGPARGIAGEVVFSDLLGLVTLPHQRLSIAAINPGIEVGEGELLFQLKPGAVAGIEGGRWPFLGGMLALRPVDMRFGVEETRRFVIAIEALDAARFLERMELGNISATGTFDGTLPIVFDENGGRIEGGLLESRPPGGSLSYVGALTYKDLSPIANFAFDALKSLDYRTMRVAMDGALEGEIVTRVRFDGVKQGAGAKRNFLTRRIARLPLQFNVNLRAPFYNLITNIKAIYDPAFIRDPRSVGLVDAQGRPAVRPPSPPAGTPPSPIQPPVSESRP